MVFGMVARRSRAKEGLGAFCFGHRIELASQNLCAVKMSVAGMGAAIPQAQLSVVAEIFPLNLMVLQFSLLGGISCGFYHFFVSDLCF